MSEFLGAIKKIKKEFEAALRSFQEQEYSSSIGKASLVLEELSVLIQKLSDDYPRALQQYKFPKQSDIKSHLKSFAEDKNIEARIAAYTDDLIVLDSYIEKLEKEIRHNYPRRPAWLTFLNKKRKPLIWGLGGVFLALVVFALWNAHQSKRHGLLGQYFEDKELRKFYSHRTDHKIDFNWSTGSAWPKWRKDDFSVRWVGYIRIPEDGVYEFFTNSDDGVALWVGSKKIISNWTTHRVTEDKGQSQLSKGYYSIRLEYYEEKRRSVIRFLWKKAGESRAEVVPSKYLVPSKDYLDPRIPIVAE